MEGDTIKDEKEDGKVALADNRDRRLRYRLTYISLAAATLLSLCTLSSIV